MHEERCFVFVVVTGKVGSSGKKRKAKHEAERAKDMALKKERLFKRIEYFRFQRQEIDDFRKNVLKLPAHDEDEADDEPSPGSLQRRAIQRLLVKNYENIFGKEYLTRAERQLKAEKYLDKLARKSS